jgi:hypothetical protein
MKTPITDAAQFHITISQNPDDSGVFLVDSEIARRLELDRAALMDVAQDGEALIAGKLMGAEWKKACRAYLTKAAGTLATARANFPTE